MFLRFFVPLVFACLGGAVTAVPAVAQIDVKICHQHSVDDEVVEVGCFPNIFGSSSSSSSSLAETTTTLLSTTTTRPDPTTTTSTTTTTTSTTSTTVILGDPACADPLPDPIDNVRAGLVTASDALFVLNAAVGLQACLDCYCDVNGSGSITSTDSLATLNIAVGIDTPLLCPDC